MDTEKVAQHIEYMALELKTISLNIARSTDEAERQAAGETLTTAEAIYGEDINENARPDSFFDPNAEEGQPEQDENAENA